MNDIAIEYGKKSVKFSLPSGWEDMAAKQVVAACRLAHKEGDAANFKVRLLFALLPPGARRTLRRELGRLHGRRLAMRNPQAKRQAQEDALDFESQIVRLSETLAFVKSGGSLTANPVPVVRIGLRRLHGASADLSSCTYEEYVGASHYLGAFARLQPAAGSGAPDTDKAAADALHRGLACLWLPKANSDAARRRAMSDEAVARRAKRIARLNPATVSAMLLLAQSGMKRVVEAFPTVFTDDGDGDGSWGHAEVIINLAGAKLGTVDETARRKLYTILKYIEYQVKTAVKGSD